MTDSTTDSVEKEEKKVKADKEDDVNSLDERGPWGLVIIFAAFMIQFFTLGTATSIGIYNVEFLEYFDNDVSGVALLTSLNIAIFMGGGPLANLLTKRFSHRSAVMLGAALVVIGIFSMPWFNSLPAMIVLYGFLAGLGFCFCYVPSHVLSGMWYNKYRSLATGLATSGSGLGTAIFPPLASYLIDVYTWKGSLIIIAGLNLHVFVFGMLLLPPPPQPKEKNNGLEPGDLPPGLETPMTKKQFQKKSLCIFCDFGFDVYFVSNILWNCGLTVFIAFGPDFFILQGLDKVEASFMLTLFGLGEFVGGIIGGILGNIPNFNCLHIYVAVNLVGGAMVFLFPVLGGYGPYGALSFSYGLCFGVILALLIIVLADLLGSDRIGDGLGYLMIANGIGAFTGPSVAGIFKDIFGGYDQALYFAGITLFIAGFITFLIPLQKRLCREDPESNEKTVGQKCAQYNMAKIESFSSMKKSASQVESMEMRMREVQGEYSSVNNTSNSPEHRKLEGAAADGLGGEGVDNTGHKSIQVVVSENIEDVGSKGVKFDKQAFVL